MFAVEKSDPRSFIIDIDFLQKLSKEIERYTMQSASFDIKTSDNYSFSDVNIEDLIDNVDVLGYNISNITLQSRELKRKVVYSIDLYYKKISYKIYGETDDVLSLERKLQNLMSEKVSWYNFMCFSLSFLVRWSFSAFLGYFVVKFFAKSISVQSDEMRGYIIMAAFFGFFSAINELIKYSFNIFFPHLTILIGLGGSKANKVAIFKGSVAGVIVFGVFAGVIVEVAKILLGLL